MSGPPDSHGHDLTGLVPVAAHRAEILSTVAPLEPMQLALADAHGLLLAADVVSPLSLPSFDNSGMDGYAVLLADVAAASAEAPVGLTVVADIAAGAVPDVVLRPGCAARIMTGAPVPAGTEAVVPVEWTDGGTQTVRIGRAPAAAQNIRRVGEDLVAGAVVLPAGTRLGAAQIGVLAAAGAASVSVWPRPRVVVLATGDELVAPGAPLRPGQIHDSNSYALAAAVREAGGDAFRVDPAGDDPGRLVQLLDDVLIRADAIVTSGGVSAGAYDVVKTVLSRLGTVTFRRVAMQPGMPQGFGVIGADRTPIFTLPGNPVSALVSFTVFVAPALRRMAGSTSPLAVPRPVRLGVDWHASPGREQYVRARLEPAAEPGGLPVAWPVGGAGSHLAASMARAQTLVVVPAEVHEVAAGTVLDAIPFGLPA